MRRRSGLRTSSRPGTCKHGVGWVEGGLVGALTLARAHAVATRSAAAGRRQGPALAATPRLRASRRRQLSARSMQIRYESGPARSTRAGSKLFSHKQQAGCLRRDRAAGHQRFRLMRRGRRCPSPQQGMSAARHWPAGSTATRSPQRVTSGWRSQVAACVCGSAAGGKRAGWSVAHPCTLAGRTPAPAPAPGRPPLQPAATRKPREARQHSAG